MSRRRPRDETLFCTNVGCGWRETIPECITDKDRATRLSKLGGHYKNCRYDIKKVTALVLSEVIKRKTAEAQFEMRNRNEEMNSSSVQNRSRVGKDRDILDAIDEENNEMMDEAIVPDDRYAVEMHYLQNIYLEDLAGGQDENEDHAGQQFIVGSTLSSSLCPEECWSTFQHRICTRDLSSLQMKIGWIRDPDHPNLTVPGDRHTSLEIFEIVSRLNLTYAQGDLLLDFIRKLLKRKGVSVPLPVGCRSSCETVGKALLKDYENNVHFIEFTVADVYPQCTANHRIHKALKYWSCRGAYVEPLVIIAEMFQHLKVSDINSTFNYEGLDDDGNPLPWRVWSDACSGLLAKKVFEYISENYSHGAFPIFVDVSLDDTPTKSMASDTCCPLYIVIASLRRDSDPWFRQPIMLGYLPAFNVSSR
jgi:hypothetical protein